MDASVNGKPHNLLTLPFEPVDGLQGRPCRLHPSRHAVVTAWTEQARCVASPLGSHTVQVGDPVQIRQASVDGFVMDGIGAESDGTAVVFRMAWVTLNEGQIGEIGFVAHSDEWDGINAGGAALSPYRAP